MDMISAAAHIDDDILCASYNISLLIAKVGRAHTIGETLISPVILEVTTTVLKHFSEIFP